MINFTPHEPLSPHSQWPLGGELGCKPQRQTPWGSHRGCTCSLVILTSYIGLWFSLEAALVVMVIDGVREMV